MSSSCRYAGSSLTSQSSRPTSPAGVAPARAPRESEPRVEPLWRESVGRELREERLASGKRLVDVAEEAGVSPQYLSEVERGLKDPSSELLAAIAGALGLSVAEIATRVASTHDQHSVPGLPRRLSAAPDRGVSRSVMTASTTPYSSACSAVSTRSRSVSSRTCCRRLPGVLGEQLLEQRPHPLDLVGLEDQVGDRAAALGRRRVQHDPAVPQDLPPPRRAAGQQHGRGRDRLADAGRLDGGPDELHGVVDRQHRRDRAARVS